MTMEPPAETNKMEEEKEKVSDAEKCEKLDLLPESSMANKVEEKVPETIQERENKPELAQEQSLVPPSTEEESIVPDTVPDQAPKTIDEQEQDQCEAPEKVQEKKESVLNLNNEVVKMRKEVKRVRALIVRKLTRQISVLKKKKGKDADIERNQRRAARLLEEIHTMKILVPDLVTKTALQKNLDFERVCKDPKSTIKDRAVARIATHPQFNKKIEEIKAAVKAFKEERINKAKSGGKMEKKTDKSKKQTAISPEKESNEVVDKTKTESPVKSKNSDIVEVYNDWSNQSLKAKPQVHQAEARYENTNKTQSPVRKAEKSKQQTKSEEKTNTSTRLEIPPKPSIEAESDLELSDNDEKEYFDDSTEERFRKQSSGESEESDNDFFVGKVNKFRKKKTKPAESKVIPKTVEDKPETSKIQSELDELEARLKPKKTSLNSVFCSSLAGPKTEKSAGKGDSRFVNKYKQKEASVGKKDFNKQSRFQKQSKGKPEQSDLKNSKPWEKTFGKDHTKIGEKGQGKAHVRPKDRGSTFTHQAPQQPLHPSWEASKKRKEQQGQILAFQGKKIKFDDDD